MCQSDVYLAEDEGEELLMEEVGWIEVDHDAVRLRDMAGEEMVVDARLKYADLVQHKLVLQPRRAAQ
jgi:predicted RNA-binding protein